MNTLQLCISDSHGLRHMHRCHLYVIQQIHTLLASSLLHGQSFVSLRTALVLVLEGIDEMKDKFSMLRGIRSLCQRRAGLIL